MTFARPTPRYLVLLTATDETFAAIVHTRSSYKADEIRFGHKFVSIYNDVQNGEPISINVRKLSAVEKVPTPEPSKSLTTKMPVSDTDTRSFPS